MKLSHGTLDEVTNGIFVATPNPGEGTMGVVSIPQAKVAIDTSSYEEFAQLVKDAIDAQNDAPWRFVLSTHSHFDHVGGNGIFEAPIIASTLTAQRMDSFTPQWIKENVKRWVEEGLLDAELSLPARIRKPDLLFERRLTVRLAELSLEITLMGGHSEDSSVVFLPERGVLFASDLVFNGKPAATGEADLQQWLSSLQTLQEWPVDVVVAGHGPPGGPELIARQIEEIEELRAQEEA